MAYFMRLVDWISLHAPAANHSARSFAECSSVQHLPLSKIALDGVIRGLKTVVRAWVPKCRPFEPELPLLNVLLVEKKRVSLRASEVILNLLS